MIEKLFVAGVDVFRINMSHTNHDLLKTLYGHIRAVEAKLERPIGVLCDLQGPKIRIDTFAEKEVRIHAGDTFVFDTDPTPGDQIRVHLPHPEIFAAAKVGDSLLLNDGRLRVEITEATPNRLTTKVIFGGVLSNRKGVNLPDTVIPFRRSPRRTAPTSRLPRRSVRTGSRSPSCSAPRTWRKRSG